MTCSIPLRIVCPDAHPRTRWLLLLIQSLLFASPGLTSQKPTLFKDINQVQLPNQGSAPSSFATVGGVTYFAATTANLGRELWRTDGTPGGTRLVLDILPGPNSSSPEKLTAAGSLLFFTAWDETHGRELWRSDGTGMGTILVKDILSGSGDGRLRSFVSMGTVLYFVADDGVQGAELWRADQRGAFLVVDLRPKGKGSEPSGLVVMGKRLYFTANDGKWGRELWKSDGTKKGTGLVVDLTSGAASSQLGGLIVAQDVLYFVTRHASKWPYYSKLWRSDGTSQGTSSFQNVSDGNWGMVIAPMGKKLIFTAPLSAANTNTIWVSDGTKAGTKALLLNATPWWIGELKSTGRTVYFTKAIVAGQELWRTDGTIKGTQRVKSLVTWNKTVHAGKLYFVTYAPHGLIGYDLWVSDGSSKGTTIVRSFRKVWNKDKPELFSFGSMLLLSVDDGIVGRELWRSSGTQKGTALVKDLDPPGATAGSAPRFLAQVGRWAYLIADDGIRGRELWRTDGTPMGTTMVKDIRPGPQGSNITVSIRLGNKLLFAADDGKVGRELWSSDGTAAGTKLVKDIYPGRNLPVIGVQVHLERFTPVGDRVFFTARDTKHGYELWVSDGTSGGTKMVADLVKGQISSRPSSIVAFKGEAWFLAYENTGPGQLQARLWRSDGSSKGTVIAIPAKPLRLSSYLSFGMGLVVYRGGLFFRADDGKVGGELWRTDGSSKGTVLVRDITLGKHSTYLYDFDVHEDRLFFRVHADQLWKTDGSRQGTQLVKNFRKGAPSTYPVTVRTMGQRLLVLTNNARSQTAPHRKDLWITDGSKSGTTELLVDGVTTFMEGGSRRTWFLRETTTRAGLWVTDGSVKGTRRLRWTPLDPSVWNSKTLALVQGLILATQWHPSYGRELWVIDLGATAQGVGRACSSTGLLPSLRVSDPVLGSTLTFHGYEAPAQGLGLLFLGRASQKPARIGPACELYFDLGLHVLLSSFLTQQPGWQKSFTLPKTPSLLGVQVMTQAVFLNASSGLSFSPGQFLSLGL